MSGEQKRWGDPIAWALYDRLGSRYPLTILTLDLAVLYLVFGGLTACLPVWIPMSTARFLSVLGVAFAVVTVLVVLSAVELRRQVRPIVDWVGGARSREKAEAAWRAGTALPQRLLYESRFIWTARSVLSLAWAGFVTWRLGLPAYALVVLPAGAGVAGLYATAMIFFMMEVGMQPLLFDIAQQLGEVPIDDRARVPLRYRLLVAVPTITVGSSVLVAGLAGTGSHGIARLAIDVGVAYAITATVALFLTWMLAGSIVNPLRVLREATERISRGDLAVRVPVVSSDETGELTSSFNRMVSGLEERERLHHALGTFVDPEVAERVLSDGTDLAGEELELSVVFVDVRDFTSFAERSDAHRVVARLNELYEHVVPVVLRHGGHANKFIGDGLLAIFGAPERYADHADRAVGAALEIAELVRSRYRGSLRVGIGVNSGRVVVGTVGGGGRLDFTVIGDPVNTAARVEAATRETDDDVLITDTTRRLVSRSFGDWQRRPAIPLKGKARTVDLFAPAAQHRPPANIARSHGPAIRPDADARPERARRSSRADR